MGQTSKPTWFRGARSDVMATACNRHGPTHVAVAGLAQLQATLHHRRTFATKKVYPYPLNFMQLFT